MAAQIAVQNKRLSRKSCMYSSPCPSAASWLLGYELEETLEQTEFTMSWIVSTEERPERMEATEASFVMMAVVRTMEPKKQRKRLHTRRPLNAAASASLIASAT